jgi:GTP cyclohydrolase IA
MKKTNLEAAGKLLLTEILGGSSWENNDELKDTPSRFAKAMEEWFTKPQIKMAYFDNESDDSQVMIYNIGFNSFCEHHLSTILGNVHIGYVPDRKVLGISKLPRIVEYFSKSLMIQERFTRDIHDYIMNDNNLLCNGVIVYVTAIHTCMSTRGVKSVNSYTNTIVSSGIYKGSSKYLDEFKIGIPK